MIIAGPRSGTTWAANWLTTDSTHCLHDPLYQHHYEELDGIESIKSLGVSCTGLMNFPKFVNAHPARKVILRRPQREVDESLHLLGLPSVDCSPLDQIEGTHYHWKALFDDPKMIYESLTGRRFNAERHDFLKTIHVQPQFQQISINRAVTTRLLNELRGL